MRTGQKVAWIVAVLAAGFCGARAQTGASVPSPLILLSSSALDPAGLAAQGELVREIDDPYLGNRWLLVRDSSHPGGPGRLLLVSAARRTATSARQRMQAGPAVETPAPVIRSGESVVVEEHTRMVDARLEAVALGPATAGSEFNVRLSIGGRIVRAVAVAYGRAALAEEPRR